MQFKAEGVIVAMVTPMTRKGAKVDLNKTRRLVEFLAEEGAHGLFVCGTTGEGPLLSSDERREVLETVIDTVGQRLNVIAHTGAATTAEAIALTRHASEAGAKAAAAVAPYYFGYDRRALMAYYGDIAKAVPDLPVLLYNIPACTGNPIPADLALSAAMHNDNIAGMKDSSGDMAQLRRILSADIKGFNMVSGNDLCMFQALAIGAQAVVSGPANIATPICRDIYDNIRKGKHHLAWKAQEKLTRIVASLDYAGNIAGYKEALRLRGVDAGWVRPPQRELRAPEKGEIAKGLREVGLM